MGIFIKHYLLSKLKRTGDITHMITIFISIYAQPNLEK
jgi:hypothetical protein